MLHIYQNIQGWFNDECMYDLIIDHIPDNFVFVEVGVWKGKSISYFTVQSINKNKNGKIYAVDHWEGSEEHKDINSPNYDAVAANSQLFDVFSNNISPIKDYLSIVRKPSVEASNDFTDESLDAVFIDASHDYQNVKKDILAWYPKIKHGGIISGHDYIDCWPEVKMAVSDFLLDKNTNSFHTNGSCWYYYK